MELIINDESEDYRDFHNIRKVVFVEFVNYDAHKLVHILNLFHLLHFVIVNPDVDKVLYVDIEILRENMSQLVEEGKHNTCFAVIELIYT